MSPKPPLSTVLLGQDSKLTAAVGPGAGITFVQRYFPSASTIRIASAYFSLTGYKLGRDAARPEAKFSVLVGREEGANVRKAVIEEIHTELRGCETTLWEAVSDLVSKMKAREFKIRDARQMEAPFHCKFFICDDTVLWQGSANYSRNGLLNNAEQVGLLTNNQEIKAFTDWFDLVSCTATDLLDDLIILLDRWLKMAEPFDVYLQSLRALSSVPEPSVGRGAYSPTYYQRAAIARSLRQIDNFGGALIVIATGLGKTVIGAEILHRLQWMGETNTLILFAPNAVRESWEEQLNGRGLHPLFFPSEVLFRPDSRKRHHLVSHVSKHLALANGSTLIIVDEAHFYRNQILAQHQKQRPSRVFQRLVPAVKAGAKIVLLTATAYGTSVRNLQSLLHLLPHKRTGGLDVSGPWDAQSPEEFSSLPVVTILGLPDVLALARRRNDIDENDRPFIPVGEKRLYLPLSVKLKPVNYELPLEPEIHRLFDQGYFNHVAKLPLKAFDDDRGEFDSATDTGYNAGLNAWMSSPPALREFVEHSLAPEGEPPQLDFVKPTSAQSITQILGVDSETTEQLELIPDTSNGRSWGYGKSSARYLMGIEKRRRKLEPLSESLLTAPDYKLAELVKIVRETCLTNGGKALIFVKFHRTALHLEQHLTKAFHELAIGCTVSLRRGVAGLKPRHVRDEILRQFSPGAYSYETELEYDVLIGTDADGVGVNLQDSDTIVNYDPPGAADILFQRAGRVLRMTERSDRIVTVYTFVPNLAQNANSPGTTAHLRERFTRLNRRHHRSRGIVGGAVLAPADEINVMDEVRIDVEQWFREGDLASRLTTRSETSLASHMTLLEEFRERADSLVPPLHTAKLTYRFANPHVIACFEYEADVYLLLYDCLEDCLSGDHDFEILDHMRCEPTEQRAMVHFAEVERTAHRAVELWCERHNVELGLPKMICAMYLQPIRNEIGFTHLLNQRWPVTP